MMKATQVPKEKCLDNTIKLLLEGYQYIPSRCQKFNSDLFQTRLMGQSVICMSGEEASKIFYDNNRFTRKGAAPKRVQKTLFGENGVQTMDGAAHIHRKQFFQSIMTPQNFKKLNNLMEKHWRIYGKRWQYKDEIVLFDEVQKLLCQVACKWAGVPLRKSEVCLRAGDFTSMIDAFGAVGPRHWKGRWARSRTELWIADMIREVRYCRYHPSSQSILNATAWHRDYAGKLLTPQVAAVELINVLRPIIAITTYITFGALAMHEHPQCRRRLQTDTDDYATAFAQEIRRFYPFGPFVGARVRREFIWKNCPFKQGSLVLFDLYGTNHDPTLWEKPYQFIPERFLLRSRTPFDFVPQGGGDPTTGHRCPGEQITVDLIKVSMKYLANQLEYHVPTQDFHYSLTRMPTLPKDKFILRGIRSKI